MREYYNKLFHSTYEDKKILGDNIKYKVYTAGIHFMYVDKKINDKLIKKIISICKKEFNKFGKSDSSGANQGYYEDLFFCVHWEEKEIIVMYEGDK